ncbi:MAG TPA: hypothetical protein VM846_04840 [Vicinamibacterales bacterium]|jgi:hypothetical protein|nr:hypothetical protein [Vicinamibacterales bacterium]
MLVLTSGRIIAGEGLGWDGRGYARMMADGLDQGSEQTGTRPLLPLLTRLPHAFGLDVIPSFQVMNAVYAFVLYLFCALILDAYGAGMRVQALIIGNLALCIATSRMFAFYPVQIDLGVLALVTAGFYFVVTDRHAPAGAMAMLALASREFGIVVVLCGLHRAFRRGRLWPDGTWYLPAVAAGAFVRWWTYSEGILSSSEALANLRFWLQPAFVTAFAYFTVTVLGGISALLVLRPRWCVARLRAEPELATWLLVVAGLTAIGNLDVWRYLMFALPVGLVLTAYYFRDLPHSVAAVIGAAMTFVTVLTQRPFQRIDQEIYFQDWFPLYSIIPGPPTRELLTLWAMRLTALVLILIAFHLIQRSRPAAHEQMP